jgi:glucans biosynthesis protein C
MHSKGERIYAMDLLRAVAMYLGIVLHCAIVYQCYPRPGWPDDIYCNPIFDFYYQYVHSFRMQLFFLVAGYFARLLYLKIGFRSFIIHRIKRIFVPFIVSVIVLTPLCSLAFNFYKSYNIGLSWSQSWANAFDLALGWNGLFHLWFLYYLLMYYVIVVVVQFIKKRLFIGLDWHKGFVGYRVIHVLGFTLFLFGIVHTMYDGHVEPWVGIIPRFNQIIYYGFFFSIGYLIHWDDGSLWRGSEYCWAYLGFGSAISIYLFSLGIDLDLANPIYEILTSLQTILLIFGFLGMFINYFNFKSNLIRYLSDSSYWFYLIHFPLVTLAQVLLFSTDISGFYRFWIVLISSSLISLISYEYLVRRSFIGVMLNGKR